LFAENGSEDCPKGRRKQESLEKHEIFLASVIITSNMSSMSTIPSFFALPLELLVMAAHRVKQENTKASRSSASSTSSSNINNQPTSEATTTQLVSFLIRLDEGVTKLQHSLEQQQKTLQQILTLPKAF
jgi:hypothetical protein